MSLFHLGRERARMQTRGALQHTQTHALDRLATWTKLSKVLLSNIYTVALEARGGQRRYDAKLSSIFNLDLL